MTHIEKSRVQFFAPKLCYHTNMSMYKRHFNNSINPIFITFVTYNRRKILIPNIDTINYE